MVLSTKIASNRISAPAYLETNPMNARILAIDPQNDFCDIEGASLAVAGADADMRRLARLVGAARPFIADVVITLDSHASVGIERTTFWQTGAGEPVAPFTEISAGDLLKGRFEPRDSSLRGEVAAYLQALEAGGKYQLRVWPVHCVLGTWGHNVHEAVSAAVMAWEFGVQRSATKVLKGLNPLTEQYSAVRAEVPRSDDASTGTNEAFVASVLAPTDWLLVAGLASSHCVAATMLDLFPRMTAQQLGRTVLLSDCMSPVRDCEALQDKFFTTARALGVHVMTSDEALVLLTAY